jgi:hypothetical protein
VKAIHFTISFSFLLSFITLNAQTDDQASKQFQLILAIKEDVVKLQQNPNDKELREEIIKTAGSMKIALPVSQEAVLLDAEAVAAYKTAILTKKVSDFERAKNAYSKLIAAVPWVGKNYKFLAYLQEKTDDLKNAIDNYNFYLVGLSKAVDKQEVINKITSLEKKTSKEKSEKEIAEQEQKARKRINEEFAAEHLIKSYVGFFYTLSYPKGNFSDNSISNLKAGYANKGWGLTFDANFIKNRIGHSYKFIHGFCMQLEANFFKFNLPYTPIPDVTKDSSLILLAGSTSGTYYFANAKIGWGFGYRINRRLTVNFNALYGSGPAVYYNPATLDSKLIWGYTLRTTLGAGLKVNLTTRFGFMIKIEYSFGNQKYSGSYNIYALNAPKIGYNTLNFCIGIVL